MELRRPQQAQPTKEGWYYANAAFMEGVEPVYVMAHFNRLEAYQGGTDVGERLTEFMWFGPVPTCVEASRNG